MRRIHPLLLILPLIGLALTAAFLLVNTLESAPRPITPAPVTVPPLPTVVNVAGEALIDFTLPTLAGDEVSLSDYAGRVVFLNFWATWCEPCKRELPTFVAFTRSHPAPDDPVILAVNLEETPEQVRDFATRNGIAIDELTVLIDAQGTAADRYGVFTIPVTFVIDQTGVVRYPSYGELTLDEIQAYLDALARSSATMPPEAAR